MRLFFGRNQPSRAPVEGVQEQFARSRPGTPSCPSRVLRPSRRPTSKRCSEAVARRVALRRDANVCSSISMIALRWRQLSLMPVAGGGRSASIGAWSAGPGPITFRQSRLGLNGRAFGILKFRTMNVVEDGDAVVQAERATMRASRASAQFLRDGEHRRSAAAAERDRRRHVAGRPAAACAVAHDDPLYASLIPEYVACASAWKPGITGWAQVNGLSRRHADAPI